ncbi:hypothetical protein ABEV74_06135, partial [Paenibacillus cisolokensis]|uniref:hypothetical protein n=1 Tax=Paenibacillus cisolokensis TaxID=1658519 RepID=UPI003D2DA375
MAKILQKYRNFGPNRGLWRKIMQKYSIFWKFRTSELNGSKKVALSQEFSRFGHFAPEKAALLQHCSFIGVLSSGVSRRAGVKQAISGVVAVHSGVGASE